jgi:hypothetical protein
MDKQANDRAKMDGALDRFLLKYGVEGATAALVQYESRQNAIALARSQEETDEHLARRERRIQEKNLFIASDEEDPSTEEEDQEEEQEEDQEEEECAKKRERDEDYAAQNQQTARKEVSSGCKVTKREYDCKLEMKVNEVVDGPDHCIHCDEEPCVFTQIESRLCENDDYYFHEEDYAADPVAYNSKRRKRAYQQAAFVVWEGINYRKPHFKCVEIGVRSLFPPFDGKVMGYKTS